VEIRTEADGTFNAWHVEIELAGTWHLLATCPSIKAAEVVTGCIKSQIIAEQLQQIVESVDE
jgi:hypothetical protein